MKHDKRIIKPAEFFDVAAEQGFYGLTRSGLTGKHDNVRKYWEDTVIKLTIRNPIEKLLTRKDNIRIVDLGCGSGEGYELLTRIPTSDPSDHSKHYFVLSSEQISYTGIDISESMLQQGRKNYENRNNVQFIQADLNKGFPLMDKPPFDVYFSSYSSLSHPPPDNLKKLVEDMLRHARQGAIIVFDMIGKFSPEWPTYWNEKKIMLPYNMAYLMTSEARKKEPIQWYDICYWEPSTLIPLLKDAANNSNVRIEIVKCIDRSIFVGRHIETGFFGAKCLDLRSHINHLFDPDHRVKIENLFIDLEWCKEYGEINPQIWERLLDYKEKWNCVISIVEALISDNNNRVSQLIETTSADISNELKFLTWLYRNAYRFPVVDFWASVMGPQIALILRNIEMSFDPALGCGHGLLCTIEVMEN